MSSGAWNSLVGFAAGILLATPGLAEQQKICVAVPPPEAATSGSWMNSVSMPQTATSQDCANWARAQKPSAPTYMLGCMDGKALSLSTANVQPIADAFPAKDFCGWQKPH